MFTGQIEKSVSIAGVSFKSTIIRYGSGSVSHQTSLAAGKAGSLTTRTSDVAGTVTANGHGFQVGDLLDLHWTNPDGTAGVRYGVRVDAQDANTFSFDDVPAAAGDVLPAQSTALVASKQTTLDVDFAGDGLKMIVVSCNQKAHIHFRTSAPATAEARKLGAGEPWEWASDMGFANPFAGETVADAKVSNGSTTAATLTLATILDSDS